MEFWFFVRAMLSFAIINRLVSRDTLDQRRDICFRLCQAYHTRCKLWLNTANFSCQRCQHIFYLYLFAHQPRALFQFLHSGARMDKGDHYFVYSYSDSISGLCSSLRPNIFLRGNCHYQLVFSHPFSRRRHCFLALRGVRRWKAHTQSFFCPSFFLTIYSHGLSYSSSFVFASKRLQEPFGAKQKF